MSTDRRLRFALLGSACLVACTNVSAEAPEGFATFDDWSGMRAVSSNGVMFRVRHEANEPVAELPFWREALKNRMTDAGYAFVSDDAIEAGGVKGYLLELAAPVGQEDYTYLIGLFVRGEDLLIAEATGEVTRLAEHRPAILAAVGTVK